MTSTHTRLLAATLALACQLSPAQAAKVDWADFGVNAAGAGAPEIIGAPDATTAGPGDWHLAKFNTPGLYPTLAAKIGLSEAELVSYDVIAWEGNAGSPAAGGGWESARWTFSDFITSVSSTFNELTGGSSDPTVQFKTGSVAGAVYNTLFGTGVPEKEVWS